MNAPAPDPAGRLPRKRGLSLPLFDIEMPEYLRAPPATFSLPPCGEERAAPSEMDLRYKKDNRAPWRAPPISVNRQAACTALDLYAALAQGSGSVNRLGDALVGCGWLEQSALERALEVQKEMPGKLLGEIVLSMGLISPERLTRALAERLGIPVVDVRRFEAEPGVRSRIPASVCARHGLIPLQLHEGALVVAMSDPFSEEAIHAARFASGLRVIPVLAEGGAGREAIDRHIGRQGVHELTLVSNPDALPMHEEPEDTVSASDTALVRLVNRIIHDALAAGASDVHIEPGAGKRPVRVRFRRDGVLSEYAELPARLKSAVVSRLKIMAGLDIAERRRPQDGRIDFARFGGVALELRLATIPTPHGVENIVLRLLNTARAVDVDTLGIEAVALRRIKSLVARPHGLILVCGPTGSGKTTTLHSLIAHINTPERKIWTAEDPVEITQEGLCQVQVNARIGFTFAAALRSMLRADPDVIMVGEMRDPETAATAIDASLTGHLVLSTLHTNSAAETIGRLLELDVDPFAFSDSLLGVVGQRLVRRVCPDCRHDQAPCEQTLATLAEEYAAQDGGDAQSVMTAWRSRAKPVTLARGTGCDACDHTGLRGRLGIFEFLEVTPRMRTAIQRKDTDGLRSEMAAGGMRTLLQDGIEKALLGLTTLEQVRATAG